jgi:hypothetical protein
MLLARATGITAAATAAADADADGAAAFISWLLSPHPGEATVVSIGPYAEAMAAGVPVFAPPPPTGLHWAVARILRAAVSHTTTSGAAAAAARTNSAGAAARDGASLVRLPPSLPPHLWLALLDLPQPQTQALWDLGDLVDTADPVTAAAERGAAALAAAAGGGGGAAAASGGAAAAAVPALSLLPSEPGPAGEGRRRELWVQRAAALAGRRAHAFAALSAAEDDDANGRPIEAVASTTATAAAGVAVRGDARWCWSPRWADEDAARATPPFSPHAVAGIVGARRQLQLQQQEISTVLPANL